MQRLLDEVIRNRVIHEKIAMEMGEMEYERSWQQCRTKLKI